MPRFPSKPLWKVDHENGRIVRWDPTPKDPREMMHQLAIVALFFVVLISAYYLFAALRHNFVLNITSSIEPGLYQRVEAPIEPGALVRFRPSAETREWLQTITGSKVPDTFIKPVHKMGPFSACMSDDGSILLDNALLPKSALEPRFIKAGSCQDFGPEYFFALATRAPNSFDSRHYGPIQVISVTGVFDAFVTLD